MAVVTAEPQTQTTFAPSGLVDLYWAMITGTHPHECDPVIRPPVPGVSDDAELSSRLAGFWDDGVCDFAELVVLGHHAGLLRGPLDSATLSMALDLAVVDVPVAPALASEKDSDRAVFHGRLRALRDDPELRASYISLASDVWSAMEDDWIRRALPAATAVADKASDRMRSDRPWLPLFVECDHRGDYVAASFERASANVPVLVAVSIFGSVVMLDLPGLQLVGLRMANLASDARERAGEIARRLRAVADPTRLVLLELLAGSPRSVGELAREVGVSQPTVSNHVKVLREARLVRTEHSGSRSSLTLDRAVLDEVLGEPAAFVRGSR
ncbi:MAG: ArsR/SmtB family transcription factor [Acidimicrobiales bacterium]